SRANWLPGAGSTHWRSAGTVGETASGGGDGPRRNPGDGIFGPFPAAGTVGPAVPPGGRGNPPPAGGSLRLRHPVDAAIPSHRHLRRFRLGEVLRAPGDPGGVDEAVHPDGRL